MRKLYRFGISSLLALLTLPLAAVAAEVDSGVDEVLVVGEQPGPALWKVSKGEHVLWILGTNSPSPKDVVWRSGEVERVLSQSQEVIGRVRVRAGIGRFKALTLLPSLAGVRKNPDGRKLQEVVPADLYARWQALKSRYIGRDAGVESWRPIFAAEFLYRKALEKSGLVDSTLVGKAIDANVRKFKLKSTSLSVSLALDNPRQLIRDFKQAEVADLECFATTIARLETDLSVMRTRANAWARGDVAALRRLAPIEQQSTCIAAVLNSRFGADRGFSDIPARTEQEWVSALDAALTRNASTFTMLPVSELFNPAGALRKLRERGYVVEEP